VNGLRVVGLRAAVSSEERVLSQSETAGSEASLSQLPADGGPARHAVSFELLRRYAHWLRKWIGPEAFAAVSTHDVVHGVGAAWGQGPHGRGYAHVSRRSLCGAALLANAPPADGSASPRRGKGDLGKASFSCAGGVACSSHDL